MSCTCITVISSFFEGSLMAYITKYFAKKLKNNTKKNLNA